MASATETAILAVVATLTAIATANPTALPAPLRNEDLAARLGEITSTLVAYLNLWDGGQVEREEYLGAGNGVANGYGITHQCKLEFALAGDAAETREAAYDAGLILLFDGLVADRTLGGAVDWIDIGDLQGPGSDLITDGVPGAKGVVLPIVLTFRSSRPF